MADSYSQGRLIKERLRRWREGEFGDLWKDAVKLTKLQPKSRRPCARVKEQTEQKKNAERALTLHWHRRHYSQGGGRS